MPIQKKKKKKEEFDASLMSNYLPGARTPVATVPADALSKVYSIPPIAQCLVSKFLLKPRRQNYLTIPWLVEDS